MLLLLFCQSYIIVALVVSMQIIWRSSYALAIDRNGDVAVSFIVYSRFCVHISSSYRINCRGKKNKSSNEMRIHFCVWGRMILFFFFFLLTTLLEFYIRFCLLLPRWKCVCHLSLCLLYFLTSVKKKQRNCKILNYFGDVWTALLNSTADEMKTESKSWKLKLKYACNLQNKTP